MPVFATDEQLYASLRILFGRIEAENPQASDALLKSRLSFRFRCSEPDAVLVIDARQRPLHITYGLNNSVKPDLDVQLSTDTLHQILLGQLSLTKALGSKQLVPTGPVWKTMVLADLFQHAKTIYPQVLQEQGLGSL
ncbi:MAG: SCP2 sterol-binding domain-containing protein [Ardenticatenaceae bacterium]|nr:SCP2 sterol-binding domain-containing protein [Ardenticatenaceae bacterium]MCB9445147.1 SCP2 sterol-binding domain-containing protein [Ardenticatenaceae bacterium]